MTQNASLYWKPEKNKRQQTSKNKKTKKTNKQQNNKQNTKQKKTVNSARFETQRDFVLLPNRRILLIPLALKVHSLLRCLLPSCDQNS